MLLLGIIGFAVGVGLLAVGYLFVASLPIIGLGRLNAALPASGVGRTVPAILLLVVGILFLPFVLLAGACLGMMYGFGHRPVERMNWIEKDLGSFCDLLDNPFLPPHKQKAGP